MIETVSVIDAGGWVVLSILAVLLLLQGRQLRSFERPRFVRLEEWPSLTVILTASAPDATIRASIAEVSSLDYRGDLEILVETRKDADASSLDQLALASQRVRIVDTSRFSAVSKAEGEWLLTVPHGARVETDTVERLVSTAVESGDDCVDLLPRLALDWGIGMFKEPLLPWMRLTFTPSLARALPPSEVALRLVKRDRAEEEGSGLVDVRTMDGYDSTVRGALDKDRYAEALWSLAGSARGRLVVLAMALPLLFTVPVVAAIATASFPWIVAAVVSYWIRFRVAARTGEPIPLAFLHPLVVLIASADAATVAFARSSRNTAGTET